MKKESLLSAALLGAAISAILLFSFLWTAAALIAKEVIPCGAEKEIFLGISFTAFFVGALCAVAKRGREALLTAGCGTGLCLLLLLLFVALLPNAKVLSSMTLATALCAFFASLLTLVIKNNQKKRKTTKLANRLYKM